MVDWDISSVEKLFYHMVWPFSRIDSANYPQQESCDDHSLSTLYRFKKKVTVITGVATDSMTPRSTTYPPGQRTTTFQTYIRVNLNCYESCANECAPFLIYFFGYGGPCLPSTWRVVLLF